MSSVVGDSKITWIYCQRRLIDAIQLAVSFSDFFFSLLCPETDWKIRIGKRG